MKGIRMNQQDVRVVGGTLVTVGLSQIIRIGPSPFQSASSVKIDSGGGTLEIVAPVLSGTSTAGNSGWGKGYKLGSTEVYNVSSPCVFYFAATGATMIASLIIGYSTGASMP